jgi:WD40 repeat protein
VDSLFIDHQLSTINDDAVLLAATTKLVASMALNKIKLWNYQNTLVSEINAENVLMMEFDLKSNLVAMCQNQIIIWSENGQPKHTHTLQLGLANFLKMKFDSTRKILFTSTSTNEIISWNTELGRSISSYCYFYSEIIDFAIAPNNALLASVTASNIKVFNYRTNHFVFEKDLIEDPKSVSFTSNSKILIVGYTNKIELWQLETKTLKQLIQIEYQIQNAWTLLNKFIVVECIDNENKKIIVLDQTTYETLSALTMKTTCYAIISK